MVSQYWNHLVECCVPQAQGPHYDNPYVSPEMYNLAISLIQRFDEMEGKESRWGQNFHTDMLNKNTFSIFKQKFGCDSTTVCLSYAHRKYKSTRRCDISSGPLFAKKLFFKKHSLCACGAFLEASCFGDFLEIISVTNKILCFRSLCSKDSKERGDMTLSERGSVLVFLPGISEIRNMQEALSKLVHKRWAFWRELMDQSSPSSQMSSFGTLLSDVVEKGKRFSLWCENYGHVEILVLLQVAGLSSPLHCYTGGAEWCVFETSSWFQEGKNMIFLTFF